MPRSLRRSVRLTAVEAQLVAETHAAVQRAQQDLGLVLTTIFAARGLTARDATPGTFDPATRTLAVVPVRQSPSSSASPSSESSP